MPSHKIVILGAGNVATHLGIALMEAGHEMVQVWSRSTDSALGLAGRIGAAWTTDLNSLKQGADLYLVSITDDALASVAQSLQLAGHLVAHTSGTLPMELLDRASETRGVFYPLQTFSKAKALDLRYVPVCLEANTEDGLRKLTEIARSISGDVRNVNSAQRKQLHVAAVFACNFTNHMYAIADDLLTRNDLDLNILLPLINETAAKIKERPPREMQTGPAVRGDERILAQHREALNNDPRYREIYELVSQSIREQSQS